MKHPALIFVTLLIACGLISAPTLRGQEATAPKAAGAEKAPKGPVKAESKTIKTEKYRKTAAAKGVPKKAPAPEPAGVMMIFEWIEVEHEDFSEWVLENKLAVDATELRKEVQKWVKEDDAEVMRTAIIHARSGQRAMAESIKEIIYPTEYDTPQPSHSITLEDAEAPIVPPNGRAFETRNVGTTVEVDPVISEDGQLIDLNLSPEMIFRLDDIEWASSSNGERLVTKMPLFYTMKATTQVEVKSGSYALIATLQLPPDEDDDDDDNDDNDEIVLLFVRADVS